MPHQNVEGFRVPSVHFVEPSLQSEGVGIVKGSMTSLCGDARISSCQGSVKKMNVVLVQGKMIRYVHIPDDVDAIRNLQEHVSSLLPRV